MKKDYEVWFNGFIVEEATSEEEAIQQAQKRLHNIELEPINGLNGHVLMGLTATEAYGNID